MDRARTRSADAAAPDVSVVVPTFREAENLPLLLPAISTALRGAGLTHETVIVDDNSRDGSVEVVEELGAEHGARMLVRTEERGLSSAVIHGFRSARGRVLACMDADLSHPPEALPIMAGAILDGRADFVVGSRYAAGGSVESGWSLFRRLNSLVATLMARPLARVSDPMSGLFALRREAFEGADELDAIGYKIGLELLVKSRPELCMETPIHFRDRRHGQSKLTLRQQVLYIQHLARLLGHVRSLRSRGVDWRPANPALLRPVRVPGLPDERSEGARAA